MSRIFKVCLVLISFVVLSATQGCMSTKNEFNKKKYKIKKDMPPAQRYYNKYSLFNAKPEFPKTRK